MKTYSEIYDKLAACPRDNYGYYTLETIWGQCRFELRPPNIKWQMLKAFSTIEPFTWTLEPIMDFWNNMHEKAQLKYEVVSCNRPGEHERPKRPKELKGIQPIGSVRFSKASCPVFVYSTDVYINHNDYFSPSMPIDPQDHGTPLNYRSQKYLGRLEKKKFMYDDNWGDIVLRRRAWIKIQCMVPLVTQELSPPQAAKVIKAEMINYHQIKTTGPLLEWERFYEEVARLVKEKLGITEDI